MFKPRTISRHGIVLAFGSWLLFACNESGPRVYTAQAFQADPGCLDAYAPLGLVEAEELPANCDPVCLELDGQLYVSVVCPPYPAEAELLAPEDSPDCATALQAVEDELDCEALDAGL